MHNEEFLVCPIISSLDTIEPDLKKSLRLPEGQASLGIMEDHLRVPVKPLNTMVSRFSMGFQRGPKLGLHEAERSKSLWQLNAWSL